MSETAKPQVKVSEVLELLEQGKDRKEIAEHYGIPVSVMARTVWQHPKLKNKKAKKQYDIQVEDDTVDPAQTTLEQQIAEVEGNTEIAETAETVETATAEQPSTEEIVEEVIEEGDKNLAEQPANAWETASQQVSSEEEEQ